MPAWLLSPTSGPATVASSCTGRSEQELGGDALAIGGEHRHGNDVGALNVGEGLGVTEERVADVVGQQHGLSREVQRHHHPMMSRPFRRVSGVVHARSPPYSPRAHEPTACTKRHGLRLAHARPLGKAPSGLRVLT